MSNRNEAVDRYMVELEHPLKPEIERVRSIILASGDDVTEHIKWNAPSFRYRGDDRVTLKLHPKGRLELIFHRGASVRKDDTFSFKASTGIVTWLAPDRGVVRFRDMEEIEAGAVQLASLVRQWMQATSRDE